MKIGPRVGIVDYGMGNLWSIEAALRNIEVDVSVVNDPDELRRYSHLILPGVGSFRRAAERMSTSGLRDAIRDEVSISGRPILGICLGMQLLGLSSTEDGESSGLALLPIEVDRFTVEEVQGRRIPHIGFSNTFFPQGNFGIFGGLKECTDFYYVHSFRMPISNLVGWTAVCDYGTTFLAGVDFGNVCGTQFHPEKSQAQGLHLLRNFVQRKY